jgi:hypothetical protein
MVGKRIQINEMKDIVSELWGLTGIIEACKTISREATRGYYCRTVEQCPDDIQYIIKFDKPIIEGNLKGWKNIWMEEKHFTVIN